MPPLSNIFLIGPPGAGKSAAGAALAQKTGRPFHDTDQEICARSSCSIEQIFAERGEAAFRRLEREALQQLVRAPAAAVVATGGGIVLDRRNVALMREHGCTVLLQARSDTLEQRLERKMQQQERPLLQNGSWRDKLRQLLREREALYRQAADRTVQTDALSPVQVAAQIFSEMQTGG